MSARVLLLIKGLGRGGAEQLLASGARHVDRTRFDYEVAYLLPHKDALVGELRDAGMPVTCLEGAQGPAWVGRLRRLVRERRIDLVHAHSPVAAIGSRIAFGVRRPRLVYTEHNVWARYHPVTYWANMATFFRNDHVFAVAEHVQASMRYPRPLSWLPMPPTETLHQGIDVDVLPSPARDGVRAELGIADDAPVVGTIANFKTHKAHDVLLRAAVDVRRAIPNVRFVLVGTGPLEADVRRLAETSGLNGTVVFAGFREDALRVASAFDVFTLASTYEGLSIALLEAMALGKPAVVTRVGGLPEVVDDGVTGLLVPSGEPGSLAGAIVRLLEDPGLRDRLGEAGRRRAATFDIRRAVRRTEDVYEELLT